MSELVYTCECGKISRINSSLAGRVSRCVRCRREYVVPQSPGSPEKIPESHGPAPSAHDEKFDSEDILDYLPPNDQTVNCSPLRAPTEPTKKIVLGKYEIREKVGEGGMGNVFAAWDTELHREVTIKLLNEKGKQKNHFKERFLNEARITGRLEHSGVVPVHLLDYDSKGMPYYVMRLLEGRTLAQLIDQYHHSKIDAYAPESLRKLLRHFIDVCHTIAFAHDHFIVHRDIKPSNVMLGGYGETMVLDWGLAKALNAATDDNRPDINSDDAADDDEADAYAEGLTIVGGRVGTSGYQSPEYLRYGESHPSDDIYALGVMLYYLLCGKLPYASSAGPGVFERMVSPPQPPHLVNPQVSRPLSAICLCALAFDKEKRYSKADLLAADIQRYLDDEPISLIRNSSRDKIVRLLRKNMVFIGIAVAMFVAGFLVARLITP